MTTFDLHTYKKASDWSNIPVEFLKSLLEQSVEAEGFPGFIVPAWVDGKVRWYAVANNQREWRKLQPILMSYVGHTVTTFDGEPSELDEDVKPEAYLADLKPYAVARLESPRSQKFALRALQRMKDSLLSRPLDLRPPPMSTAQMLSSFDMCLVNGDHNGAKSLLSRLEDELRLDGINQRFSWVKFHATFRDWYSILSETSFGELCRVRKPAVIAHHLLEAIWYCYLDEHATKKEQLNAVYLEKCKADVDDILASSGVPSDWVATTYEALFEKYHSDVQLPNPLNLIARYSENPQNPLGPLSEASRSSDHEEPKRPPDRAQVPEPESCPTTDEGAPPQVTDWLGWATALAERNFQFRESAEQLSMNPKVDTFQDPEEVRSLEEALYDLDTERALPRLNDALPLLLKWLKADEKYPRKIMAPLYEVVLLRIVEADNREGEFREGFSEMFTSLLEIGTSKAEYGNLLKELSKAIPSGAGTSDVFWVLDIADILCRYSAVDEDARKTLLNQILNSLQPVIYHMSSMQRSAYMNIASSAGWEDVFTENEIEEQSIANELKGKLVGIYTLTESAGRQAEKALKRITSDVKVVVSSEKVCSTRLTKLSQNADIMVVATSSATHAATDCIRNNRSAEYILYAAGRGCGSILRAIELNLT
jgi:hypothetical protein